MSTIIVRIGSHEVYRTTVRKGSEGRAIALLKKTYSVGPYSVATYTVQ